MTEEQQKTAGMMSQNARTSENAAAEDNSNPADVGQWPRLQSPITPEQRTQSANTRQTNTNSTVQGSYAGAVSTSNRKQFTLNPAAVKYTGPVIGSRQNLSQNNGQRQQIQEGPEGVTEVNQDRQTRANHDSALEAQRARHNEREYWRERNRQEDDHRRQMQKINEALKRTRLNKGRKSRHPDRSSRRQYRPRGNPDSGGDDSSSDNSAFNSQDRADLEDALESATEYSEQDFEPEMNRMNHFRRKSSDLKPRKPRLLKNVDNIARIRAFVQDIKGLIQRYGSEVEIQDYISSSFCEQLTNQDPRLFRVGNTRRILAWLNKQVRTEERRMRREPWKYAGKPKFDPKTGRSLYRSIELFINQLKQHMRYVGDKPETRKLFLKRAVI